jgi:DNA repair exonuclease SbcCD ATPase subunit
MMKDPAYKLQTDILLAKGKMPNADIQGIFDQLDSMKERYKKERYGESDDEDGEGKTLEEQSNELVSGLITGDAFIPKGALSFLPDEEIQRAKEKAEPLKKQHDVLSSQLTALKSQRQSVYDNYEAKKKDLSVAIKQVKYYAKIKDKAKLKKANDSYRKLQSEVNTLKSEVSKLKLGEQTGGTPSKYDKSLGAQISRLGLEINSLNRQGRRLTGQPVYGGGYYNR